jgi:nucleoid-associated protein YgaU
MALQDKYQELISFATNSGASNLTVVEQENVLYITCTAPTNQIKEQIWNIYEKLDPEMRSGDMVLNVSVDQSVPETYEVKSGDNLSKIAKKYSGISWKDIYEANRDKLNDPDKIFPGQVLTIPV